jgi:hypothetical protein
MRSGGGGAALCSGEEEIYCIMLRGQEGEGLCCVEVKRESCIVLIVLRSGGNVALC